MMLFLIAVLRTTIRVEERDDTRKLPFLGATMLALIGFFSVGRRRRRRRDPHAWKETNIGDGDGDGDDARQASLAGNDRGETRDAK